MKKLPMSAASKYFLTLMAGIVLTVAGVNAWNGLTASNGDTLDYTKWNQLVNTVQSGIPTGAVMAFNLASCPTGWSAYTAAAGRTIIGTGNGAGSNANLGDTGGDKTAPAISLDASTLVLNASSANATVGLPAGNALGATGLTHVYISGTPNVAMASGSISGTLTGGGTAPDNMQPYVALTYCQKN